MGYYFTSYAIDNISIPESAEVAFALMLEELKADLKAHGIGIAASAHISNSDGSIVRHWLEALGFEIDDIEYGVIHTDRGRESGTMYTGYFDEAKYSKGIDVVLRYLAQSGVGISITCVGEDHEFWRYHSIVGTGTLTQVEIAMGTADELRMIGKVKNLLRKHQQAGSLDQDSQNLARLLREVFPDECQKMLKPQALSPEDIQETVRLKVY
jgi:hypothetical protein